jgi:hypothetical protein
MGQTLIQVSYYHMEEADVAIENPQTEIQEIVAVVAPCSFE